MSRGLTKSQLSKLTEHLDALPSEISYLKPAILSLATQSQEMLSCGDGDYQVFDDAWKSRTKNVPNSDAEELVGGHTALLDEWARSFGDESVKWLSPAWVLYGYMTGMSLFGSEQPKTAWQNPAAQWRIDFDAPWATWRKESDYGWELKDKFIWIVIIWLDKGDFAMQFRQQSETSKLNWKEVDPAYPRPDFDYEFSFSRGSTSGLRITTSRDDARILAADYLLTVPGGHVRVMISAKKTGATIEPAQYEPLLETITVNQRETVVS